MSVSMLLSSLAAVASLGLFSPETSRSDSASRTYSARPVLQQPAAVLFCGTGPAPHFDVITDGLIASLTNAKISTKVAEGHSRASCLDILKETRNGALLYVVSTINENHAGEVFVQMQCFSADGTKLWEETQGGPMVAKSIAAAIKGATAKMATKLETHIGKAGLMPPG